MAGGEPEGGLGWPCPAFLHSAFFLLPSPPCGFGWPYGGMANSQWQMANWARIRHLTAPSHETSVQGSKFKVHSPAAVLGIGCWMLDVQCWMFGFPRSPFAIRSWRSVFATARMYLNCRHLRRVH